MSWLVASVSVDLRFATVFTFEDGQVVERRDCATLDEALQAAGLRE